MPILTLPTNDRWQWSMSLGWHLISDDQPKLLALSKDWALLDQLTTLMSDYFISLSICKHGIAPDNCAACNLKSSKFSGSGDPARWGYHSSYDPQTNREMLDQYLKNTVEPNIAKLRMYMEAGFLKSIIGVFQVAGNKEQGIIGCVPYALAEGLTLRQSVIKLGYMTGELFDREQALAAQGTNRRPLRLWHPEERVLSDLRGGGMSTVIDITRTTDGKIIDVNVEKKYLGPKRVVIFDAKGHMVGSKDANYRVPVGKLGDYELHRYEGHNRQIFNPAHNQFELLLDQHHVRSPKPPSVQRPKRGKAPTIMLNVRKG